MRTLLRSVDLAESCVGIIQGRLLAVPGVERALVDLVTGRIVVDHDRVPDSILLDAVADVGHVSWVTSHSRVPA